MIRALAFCLLVLPASLAAQGFVEIGSRALGMGGAYVAVAGGPTAAYWNPAALGLTPGSGSLLYGRSTTDPNDLSQRLSDLAATHALSADITSRIADATRAIGLLGAIQSQAQSISGVSPVGAFYNQSPYALSIYRLRMAEATPFVDTTHIGMNNDPLTGLPFNQSRLELRSLRVQDYLLSAGGPLGDPSIMVGASVHYMRGETNLTSASLFGFPNFRVGDVFDAAHPSDGTTSSRFAFDVGALLSVAQSVRIGVVGKYLGAPEFETSDGSKIRIDPRWRSGLAILPVPELTLSVDLDLTRADLGGDSRQRIGAVGAEVQTLKGALALRAGLRDALSGPGDRLYTGGIGVSIGKVTLDAAIGHSPRAGSTSWSIEVSFNSQREGQTRKPPRQ